MVLPLHPQWVILPNFQNLSSLSWEPQLRQRFSLARSLAVDLFICPALWWKNSLIKCLKGKDKTAQNQISDYWNSSTSGPAWVALFISSILEISLVGKLLLIIFLLFFIPCFERVISIFKNTLYLLVPNFLFCINGCTSDLCNILQNFPRALLFLHGEKQTFSLYTPSHSFWKGESRRRKGGRKETRIGSNAQRSKIGCWSALSEGQSI